MNPEVFARRRAAYLARLGDDEVAVFAAAPDRPRSRDVDYPYRQDSDFYYLTGFPEPDAVAVFLPGRKKGQYVLFCREYDPHKAIWEGRHAGLKGARKQYGADQSFAIDQLDEVMPELLANRTRLHYALGRDAGFDRKLAGWLQAVKAQVRKGVRAPEEIVDPDRDLHEMRLVKGAEEIAALRRAMEISARAHVRAMQVCRPGLYEYQIEAELVHEFMRGGARSPAYPSIVAGGDNACILHYTDNDAQLRDGDLLLIDAGAEYDCYAADITRTFPVNGRFSSPQRAIYELVLEAQLAAIDKVRPGNHWNEPHEAAVKVLTKGLVKLGLLEGRPSRLIKKEAYKDFYMHRTGHWLGMDVHDVGHYKVGDAWCELQPGMVLTVEPGLYISRDCKQVNKRWRGIGIRIEDDVLVTEDGCEVLTAAVPKTVEAIEAVMEAARD
ncbi:Xaa-Pro aminopeptidase [Methylomarinovum caldicuralii]|uniref:Xaa-Pro aminopeptidase n=1 Tax=Methylomarinovum caldicuralii TaxID=438856 RepID=A0AAU9C9C2_9GAMM|nr:Xaa-Pro aminopeptidase [Methylomarinovum caldicuralii]BCX81079.1 Xaa-Pro aminopeptidase [Methylomarinovum caldicuralii]